jgi:hypothetical protein
MERQYVARFAHKGETHAIRGEWSYDRISDARTLCGRRGPFSVEHLQSGTSLAVTCQQCQHAREVPESTLTVTREERGASRWVHVYGPERDYGKARYAATAEARRWARERGLTRVYWVSGGAAFNTPDAGGQGRFRYSRSYGME